MCNALLAHVAAEFFAFVPQEYAFAAHNVASLTVRSSSESLLIYSCDYLLTTSKKRPTNCFTYLLLYLQMTRDKWSTLRHTCAIDACTFETTSQRQTSKGYKSLLANKTLKWKIPEHSITLWHYLIPPGPCKLHRHTAMIPTYTWSTC